MIGKRGISKFKDLDEVDFEGDKGDKRGVDEYFY